MSGARPTPGIAEREFMREAARLFPRLACEDGYFAALPQRSTHATAPALGLFLRRNDFSRPVLRVDARLVEAFASKGWVTRSGSRWVLADAGAAWLRRRQAGADPYREQHQQRRVVHTGADGGARRPVVVNECESPLAWLRRRKDRNGEPLISAPQFEAGERLRADFTRGRLAPRVTANWGMPASSRRSRRSAPAGPAGLTDDALAARQRVERALKSVGPELAGILLDVCCHLRGLEEMEAAQGWPRRSGKVVLQLALTRLARHYGLIADPEARSTRKTRLQHWGSDDYRPTLDEWR